jgi:hypothetical protein
VLIVYASGFTFRNIDLLEGDNPVESGFVSKYKDIFLRVTEWGALEESDIGRYEIYMQRGWGSPNLCRRARARIGSEAGSGH